VTPIKCDCARKTVLAHYGRDESTGEAIVHVRSWRNNQIHVDVVVTSGVVRILCRSCGRYHRIKMIKGKAKLAPAVMDEFGEIIEAPHPRREP